MDRLQQPIESLQEQEQEPSPVDAQKRHMVSKKRKGRDVAFCETFRDAQRILQGFHDWRSHPVDPLMYIFQILLSDTC